MRVKEENKLTVLTVREIGKMLGISSKRVTEVEKNAIRKMRRHPIMIELAERFRLPFVEGD